ncbi:MAG: hypothetical protein E4G94_08760 [ANME-2 cluster archaeon]|nr:MAG: hypothetical protein E4G94_08760 [ANME-2 cluster archaeon]
MYEIIVQLKLPSSDGKYYNTDCTNTEFMFRIIQSIPSKDGLQKCERINKIEKPGVTERRRPARRINNRNLKG